MTDDLVPSEPSNSVTAIFERAERVFERRVDQLLHLKRIKARAAGTAFNARKAKRDARTVAGREKLDALVRRLADLASMQERALGERRAKEVVDALEIAAKAVVGVAALGLKCEDGDEVEGVEGKQAHRGVARGAGEGEVEGDGEGSKDMLETSSCSDDCSVGGCLTGFREYKEGDDGERRQGRVDGDRDLFLATESVVKFVLGCDDEKEESARGDAGAVRGVSSYEMGGNSMAPTWGSDTGHGQGALRWMT
eukprot:GFKZ01015663.1.p1 GENE.GFKZ01015663.1~~GFKZ01015663.1.p1  ORF type:complete len:252 (+),score=44.16 GFKZ01015663.1:454-1209(+)